jgi:hypothetical protein
MSLDTITLALDGDIPLDEFARGLSLFNTLIRELTIEIGRDIQVSWSVESLEAGSAITTIKGDSERIDVVDEIVHAYLNVGRALQLHEPIPYSDKVAQPARELTKLLNGHIKSVRFENPDEDVIIDSHYTPATRPAPLAPVKANGIVRGIVETLSRRRGIRFALYDVLFGRPVNCYLPEGEESRVKEFWGQLVVVSGIVTRNPKTGYAYNVRRITDIRSAESSEPGSYKLARGVFKLKQGETSEGAIRASRDA